MEENAERKGNFSQQDVLDWIQYKATGKFYYKEVLDGQIDSKHFPKLREYCTRAVEREIAVRVDGRDGWLRPVDNTLEEIILDDVEPQSAPLRLPMQMDEYGYIFAPALIVIAGEWNKGKTAYLLQCVHLNMDVYENNMFYFISEGAELMKLRFTNLWGFIPRPLKFKMYRRLGNFADVIRPDGLNIVDYLRVNMEKPYIIANELQAIYNKLKTGIAIVAMQKPAGRDIAFGGEGTAWEPMLYIAIGNGYSKFVKIKVPKILDTDPYRLKFEFTIRKGVKFENVSKVFE